VVTRYPWLWLRDHAHDEDTMHPVTQQRQLFTAVVPRNLRGLSCSVEDGDLVVAWDVLEPPSRVPVSFLRAHRLARAARGMLDLPVTLWNASSINTPTVAFDDVMKTDGGVAQWLGRTLQYGFCIVEGTPATAEDSEALIRRVGYVRETVFGGFWEFQPDLSKADTAYTTLELRGHTDATYSHDAPGFQLLHCLEFDGSGGESTIVDGFAVARRIEAEAPEAFEVLSTVAVPGQYIGDGAHLMSARTGVPARSHGSARAGVVQQLRPRPVPARRDRHGGVLRRHPAVRRDRQRAVDAVASRAASWRGPAVRQLAGAPRQGGVHRPAAHVRRLSQP
jgi:trimethyllysine dioxygenase